MPKAKNKEHSPSKSRLQVPKRNPSEAVLTALDARAQAALTIPQAPAGPSFSNTHFGQSAPVESNSQPTQEVGYLPRKTKGGQYSPLPESYLIWSADPLATFLQTGQWPVPPGWVPPFNESNPNELQPVQTQRRSPSPLLLTRSMSPPPLQRPRSQQQPAPVARIKPNPIFSITGMKTKRASNPDRRPLSLRKGGPVFRLPLTQQFQHPIEIWPSTVKILPEPLWSEKACTLPGAGYGIRSIQICQISNSFQIGGREHIGFRWVVLMIPQIVKDGILVDGNFVSVDVIPHGIQFAWLLDPCGRMAGREFFEHLDTKTLMERRKLYLRPRIELLCNTTMALPALIWRMENWEREWRNLLCCSVVGAKDPRSLALGTGLWATAVYQVLCGVPLNETSSSICHLRNVLGTALESIGCRELELPFLNPARVPCRSN